MIAAQSVEAMRARGLHQHFDIYLENRMCSGFVRYAVRVLSMFLSFTVIVLSFFFFSVWGHTRSWPHMPQA